MSEARRCRFTIATPTPAPTEIAVPVTTVPKLTSRTTIDSTKVATDTAIAPSTVPNASRSSRLSAIPLRYVMPKPATTHPTRRIATAPKRKPEAATTSTSAPNANQRPDDPIAGAAAERTVPSAIRGGCPGSEVRRRFAASAAGAKERVARGGAHRQMRDDIAPGPSTQASGPKAPGRLGREDARNFRRWTLAHAVSLYLSQRAARSGCNEL